MPPPAPEEPAVTRLLSRIRAGDRAATDELLPLVYDELNHLARAVFGGRSGHTLQPTALVHEAWLKLGGRLADLESRTHFFVIAGRAMRQVVSDHARAKRAAKRDGGRRRVTLGPALDVASGGPPEIDLVALDDLLAELAACEPRHAQVVELRLFGGLTVTETAATLGVTERTVYTDWAMAKAWLRTRLAEPGAGP